MLSDYSRHYLLNHLDKPARFLFFTLGEFLSLGAPTFTGMIVGWTGTGFFIGLLTYTGLRTLKRSLGGGALRHAMYWYLPTSKRHHKVWIPSHIREFIG